MMLTDSDGDYMLMIGWWAGMVKGTLPTIGTKKTRGKAGEPGNPGYLCILQIDLKTGQEMRYTTKEGISLSFGVGRSFNLRDPTIIMLQKDERKPLQFIGETWGYCWGESSQNSTTGFPLLAEPPFPCE